MVLLGKKSTIFLRKQTFTLKLLGLWKLWFRVPQKLQFRVPWKLQFPVPWKLQFRVPWKLQFPFPWNLQFPGNSSSLETLLFGRTSSFLEATYSPYHRISSSVEILVSWNLQFHRNSSSMETLFPQNIIYCRGLADTLTTVQLNRIKLISLRFYVFVPLAFRNNFTFCLVTHQSFYTCNHRSCDSAVFNTCYQRPCDSAFLTRAIIGHVTQHFLTRAIIGHVTQQFFNTCHHM